jgi:hypothetical protein
MMRKPPSASDGKTSGIAFENDLNSMVCILLNFFL